jgi:acid phosphatase
MKTIKTYSVIFLSLLLTNCRSTELTLKPINLDTAKNAVQKYYETGEYDLECREIIDKAIEHINRLNISDKSTVVFDVDDTSLSNYEQAKEVGFGYIFKLWYDWIQTGKAPAVKATKRFYDYLVSKNIHIIFLTGRYTDMYESTKRNLVETGFTKFDTLIVRSKNEAKIPAAEYKPAKRNELVKKGYVIIANVGDQPSDFNGGNSGYIIQLPNYLYTID